MRRLLAISFLALAFSLAMPTEASAQFDLSKVGALFGGAKPKPKKSPYETLAENAPQLKEVTGIWKYDSLYVEYLGNSSFAEVAISQVDAYLKAELKSADVKPGCFTLTLRSNGKGSIAYEEYVFEGNYTYDPAKARFDLTATAEGKTLTCRGFLKMVSGRLVVMMNAQDSLDALLMLFPEAKTDSTMAMVQGVIESFPGIYISMRCSR